MVGCEGPGRTVLLTALLRDCVERHGWGRRLRVSAFGILGGCGAPSPAEVEAARRAGLELQNLHCGPVSEMIDACQLIVAVSDFAADVVLETSGADGKPVVCLEDLVDPQTAGLLQKPCEPAELIEALAPEMPELLRKLIAA